MGRDFIAHLLEASLGDGEECLLVRLLAHSKNSSRQRQLSRAIESLLTRGYTLRGHFPSLPVALHDEWLGRRLVLGHARWFTLGAHFTSIVSSRLGRYGRSLGRWPVLLELIMQSVRRSGSLYLAVPDTAVAPLVEPLLIRGAVPCVRVRLPSPAAAEIDAWLTSALCELAEQSHGDSWALQLSPALSGATGRLDRWALQDRLAVCCAQRVRALLVRPRGTIAHLLEQRLNDSRFSNGTVSVFLPEVHTGQVHTDQNGNETHIAAAHLTQLSWLERGAVGWYVRPGQPHSVSLGCRQRVAQAAAPLWQLTSKYALGSFGSAAAAGEQPVAVLPRYLVHCVRGGQGRLPPAAATDFIAQTWLAGHLPDESPLLTLARILESGVLRGRAALNRTAEPCVSFSAVPLDELVARRTFQPHLGRWDWEPFGLMIERPALEALGARPVIYGDAEVYRQLSGEDRPFFQPAQRRRRPLAKSVLKKGADPLRPHSSSVLQPGLHRVSPLFQQAANEHADWEAEREWRVVGDVRLCDLPRACICLFVAYADQAQALARYSPWPVIWLQEAQTREPPSGSKHRRRKAVQTDKN